MSGECKHLVGHVEPIDLSHRTHAAGAEENIDATAAAEVEHHFALAERSDRRGITTGKAERAAAIGPFATNVTDHVAADGSNNVAITADIHDMAGAQAMMASPSPEAAAHPESHGVVEPMTVYIEK